MNIEHNIPLAKYTTFELGGPVNTLFHCETPKQLIKTAKKLIDAHEHFVLIGGGSNIVASDHPIKTHVIRYFSAKPIISESEHLKDDKFRITVSGSTILDDLVYHCADHGLGGVNFCTGIPGTVGGAIVGNAGAFGKQIADALHNLTVFNPDGSIQTIDPNDLDFSYRDSSLKESGQIVIEATLSLKHIDKNSLLKERQDILFIRHEKHPDLTTLPCAGSFFRNIEPTSAAGRREAAGWFLEEAGAKPLHINGAKVFSRHANIIVKTRSCTAQNVHDLHVQMKKIVKEKFDLTLIREVRFLGKFDSQEPVNETGFW